MDAIEAAVDAIQPELIALAQDLVRTRSYSGEEEAVVRLIEKTMHQLGYDAVVIDAMGNIAGRIGNGGDVLLFDAHVDTVAVRDGSEWRHDPFGGVIEDGMLYGRGAADMKSAAAAAVYAGALAKKLAMAAGKSVYVTGTVMEEDCDGENLKHLFRELDLKPDHVVICEPSANRIALGHKGKAQLSITTEGVSAHGSAPEKGVNAVYEMADIIRRVEQLNHDLRQHDALKGTLVLSRIESVGASLNAVPSACEIYLDRRLVSGETKALVQQEMAKLIEGKRATWSVGTLHRRSWTGMDVRYEPFHPAWEIDPNHPLTQACIEAYHQAFGRAPTDFTFWDFSTNAVTPVAMGIPTIGFGPGDSKMAHMRDEHCAVRQIVDACRFYTRLIQAL